MFDSWYDSCLSISIKRRFDILRRYSFTCRYCGRKAPAVPLHVDHAVSVSEGGTDDPSNLVVACADCNLGKGKDSIPLEIESSQMELFEYALRRAWR